VSPGGDATPPLILTAVLDPASQARFEAARQALFPPQRNQVPAHVTLFHQLPGAEEVAVLRGVSTACESPASPFATTGLRFLGFGTAYMLEMPGIGAVRQQLARAWDGWLTAQDRRPWSPHVTVQNKAPPDEAKRVHAALLAAFEVERGFVVGLAVWRYLGGPWSLLGSYPFVGTGLELDLVGV
jgi:hypothetical protein